MSTFDLFSIGHSNIPAARFIALLRDTGVEAVADVRSTPFSRRFPWFSGKNLAATLAQHGMAYLAYGDALGGRPRDARSIATASRTMRRWRGRRNSKWASTACSPMGRGLASV